MFQSLIDRLLGWKQVRAVNGFSYQVSRGGRRRIVPIDGFHHFGEKDDHWLATGQWSEEEARGGFKNQAIFTQRGRGHT